MTEIPVDLDRRRGMAAQKATEIRRLVAGVEADERALRERQDALEQQLLAAPASSWAEIADKVRYLLGLFGSTSEGRDPRRRTLIANSLDDMRRLAERDSKAGESKASNENEPIIEPQTEGK